MNKLLKTGLSILLASLMCFTLPVYAYETDETADQVESSDEVVEEESEAEEKQEEQEQLDDAQDVTETDEKCTSLDLEDTDTLFSDYVDEKLEANLNGENVLSSGSYLIDDIREDCLDAYRELDSCMSSVANGQQSSTWFEISANIQIDGDFSGDTESAALYKMRQDAKSQVIEPLVRLLSLNSPYEFYWFDKTEGFLVNSYSIQLTYDKDYSYYIINSFQIGFTVAKEYAIDGQEYMADTSKTGATISAINNANDIADQADGLDTYNKFLYFKNKVCELTDYNTKASNSNIAYGNPWQLIWVFDNDPSTKVVCEGYAKAYQYLCDLAGLTCYTVTGYLGEGGHMWNIVTADNGKNYLVDVTNCDGNAIGAPDKLFMKGVQYFDESIVYGFYISNGVYAYDANTLGYYDESVLKVSDNDYIYVPIQSLTNSASGVTVKWNAVKGATKYAVYRKEEGGQWSKYLTKSVTSTSYIDTTAVSGEAYVYAIKAYIGKWCDCDQTGKSIQYLAQPSINTISNTNDGITLNWNAIEGATGYKVSRRVSGTSKWSNQWIVTETSYTDTSAVNGTKYEYTIRALNGDYASSYDKTGTALMRVSTPVLTKAAKCSKGGNKVYWKKVAGATKYAVYRKTATAKSWTRLTNTCTTNSYQDAKAKDGTVYYYTVKAYNTTWSSYNPVGVHN